MLHISVKGKGHSGTEVLTESLQAGHMKRLTFRKFRGFGSAVVDKFGHKAGSLVIGSPDFSRQSIQLLINCWTVPEKLFGGHYLASKLQETDALPTPTPSPADHHQYKKYIHKPPKHILF